MNVDKPKPGSNNLITEAGKVVGATNPDSRIIRGKRLRSALQDSEEKYRKLTLSIQDAIVLIDDKQRVVNWNRAAEKMFGYSYKEVLGKKLHKLIAPPEIVIKADFGFKNFIASGSGRIIDKVTEVNAMRKDGTKFRAEISISVVKIKGRTHVVGVIRDITDRRLAQKKIMEAMEAAEAANIAKSQFLANMSHEIRTPMNGIIGFLELLSRTALDSQQTDYVKEMKIASESLLDLINDLLDFSKIEANKLELEDMEFNVRKEIEEVVSLFSPKANSRGIALNAIIDSSIPDSLKGDPGRLKQVIENLVSNAVKFTKNGEVVIVVKLVTQTAEKVDVLFRVTDTGIGISKDDIQRLFTPFTQVDASTTRKYGGTGLGLTISARIVEMMSGKIRVESLQGKGSAFEFVIGLKKVQEMKRVHNVWSRSCNALTENEKNSVNSKVSCDESWKKYIRILLAEDNPTNQKLTVNILKTAGLLCDIAENGNEAIKAIKAYNYDLVLMDCHMPELDGYEATRLIRHMESGMSHIVIIAMTANALKSDYKKCITSGMDDYISKPFKTNELLTIIGKWLNKELNQTDWLDELAQDQMIDRAVVYDIFNEFIDKLPALLNKIQNAVKTSEFSAITMEAHTLKGSSAGLRLNSLSQNAAELEKHSRDGDISLCREDEAKLLACCSKYIKGIKF